MDDQTDIITFCALTRWRIVSVLWQVFLQKQLEVRDGKDKVLATWIRDVITHARPLPLGEMAGVVAQLGCDRGLHQHVPLRVQSVPVVGGVNVLVDTAM